MILFLREFYSIDKQKILKRNLQINRKNVESFKKKI